MRTSLRLVLLGFVCLGFIDDARAEEHRSLPNIVLILADDKDY